MRSLTRLTLLLTLVLSGCATVTQRYPLGEPDRLAEASFEAAGRLGWTTEKLQGGKFRFIDRLHSGLLNPSWVEVTPEAGGVLALHGRAVRDWNTGGDSLGAVGPILAQATLQTLGTVAEGPPVATRSLALTVGLDLLFPAAGAAYSLRDSPYLQHAIWSNKWGAWVGMHAALDVLSAVNLGMGMDLYLRNRSTGLTNVAVGIAGLVLNRLIALLLQVPIVRMGNAAAANGLWLDPSRAPAML
jgi:hypothetical protein